MALVVPQHPKPICMWSRGARCKIEIPTCGNEVQVKRIRPRFYAFALKHWKVLPQFNLRDTVNKNLEKEKLLQEFFSFLSSLSSENSNKKNVYGVLIC